MPASPSQQSGRASARQRIENRRAAGFAVLAFLLVFALPKRAH